MFIQQINDYYKALIGEDILIYPLEEKELKNLPYFIRQIYTLYYIEFFNHKYICMLNTTQENTPLEIEKHRAKVMEVFNVVTIVAFTTMNAYNRKRLIERKIPFIIPGKQMYLPMLMIDLREQFSANNTKPTILSIPAQIIILSYLLGKPINEKSLGELAEIVNYSKMSLSRVVEEVLELQLCTVTKQGRQKIITFTKNKTELWDKSLPVLRNPIKKKKYINITDYENKENELFVSGFSGLAKYSMLSEDKNNVYAIHSSVYNKLLRNRIIEEVDKSMNEIEIWIYNPKILTCTQIVDPLSLYLSLRNTQDERVESALEELIRGMEW